ncbi:MAG TPA: alpha/beta fold hydrolase, partial [Gaiellaceae bacterium]|nr:alpha/beta fold hydrolase [Gaiellaceae bacterium]
GGSTRNRGRTIGAAITDIEAIADALGLERYATWGISGGGPHALACAALCDDRLTAAASLAGVAPWGAEGLDWHAGMGENNVKEFHLVLAGEDALRPATERDRDELLALGAEGLRQAFDTLLGEADRAALTGELTAWLYEDTAHGLEPGADGWIDDELAFVAAWGFDAAEISRPTLIVHGADDRFVPVSHGEWLAARIPGAEVWIDDANGHLTLFQNRVGEVHEWLLAHS